MELSNDLITNKVSPGEIYSISNVDGTMKSLELYKNAKLFLILRVYKSGKLLVYPVQRNRTMMIRDDLIRIPCNQKDYDYYVQYKSFYSIQAKRLGNNITLEGYIIPPILKKLYYICYNYICNDESFTGIIDIDNSGELVYMHENIFKTINNEDDIDISEEEIKSTNVVDLCKRCKIGIREASSLKLKVANL